MGCATSKSHHVERSPDSEDIELPRIVRRQQQGFHRQVRQIDFNGETGFYFVEPTPSSSSAPSNVTLHGRQPPRAGAASDANRSLNRSSAQQRVTGHAGRVPYVFADCALAAHHPLEPPTNNWHETDASPAEAEPSSPVVNKMEEGANDATASAAALMFCNLSPRGREAFAFSLGSYSPIKGSPCKWRRGPPAHGEADWNGVLALESPPPPSVAETAMGVSNRSDDLSSNRSWGSF